MLLMPRLHVANGHATTRVIGLAGIDGELTVWCDPLHEGPVPSGVSDRELVALRAAYLSNAASGADYDRNLAGLWSWHEHLSRLHEYDETVLWFEHDLFDQLNLIQILDRLAEVDLRSIAVSLISVDSFPGHPSFKGMGELSPDELRSLWPSRARVTSAQCEVARRAWTAFRDADPRQIEVLLTEDLSALPFLARALRRFLQDYPALQNGLSLTESKLLELCTAGPLSVWEAFHRMHEGENAFYITDTSFARMVHECAALPEPLLTLEEDLDSAHSQRSILPRARMALTVFGCDVRDARRDRLQYGIDRWMGGVHLEGGRQIWRWDRDAARLVLH